jgi:hypothetical protein
MWIPEMKRYYSAVPKHLVQLMPTTQYGVGDWVTEESHLMVFEEVPATSRSETRETQLR